MKKVYSKPMIFIEDFSLQTSIAVGCELDTPLPTSEDGCGYPIRGGVVVFVTGTQCTTTPPGAQPENNGQSDPYNGYCYHVPTDDKNLFNS